MQRADFSAFQSTVLAPGCCLAFLAFFFWLPQFYSLHLYSVCIAKSHVLSTIEAGDLHALSIAEDWMALGLQCGRISSLSLRDFKPFTWSGQYTCYCFCLTVRGGGAQCKPVVCNLGTLRMDSAEKWALFYNAQEGTNFSKQTLPHWNVENILKNKVCN